MATDITVIQTGAYVAEDRSWAIGEHGFNMPINVPLDWNTFTGANFTNGLAKSGCVLGKITASGKYGPYEPAATDGRQAAVGVLFNTSKIPADKDTVSSDAALVHFHCRQSRMPYQTGLGALDADARTALRLVLFN